MDSGTKRNRRDSRATCALRPRTSRFVQIFRTTPPKTVCPNFFALAHANGCMFTPTCSYCYLKSSLVSGHRRVAFTNIKPMLREVSRWIARDNLESYVLNTGNLSDSLSFEATRPIMKRLVELFRKEAAGRRHTMLVVTKGGTRECRAFFGSKPCPNVAISFSVNSPQAAERHEKGAAPVADRMRAAARLKKAGWRVRIRLDPMMPGHDYAGIVRQIRALRPERVTLGTLRAEHNLHRFVEKGLFKDLETPRDRKTLAHYPVKTRLGLYRKAVRALRDICPIGLCEEGPDIWDALGLDKDSKPCNCCE